MTNADCAPNTLELPSLFDQSLPASLSELGHSLAANAGDILQGIILCKEAIRLAPHDPLHYLHLGKIFLLDGKKPLALHAFRKGLKFGYHHCLVRELERLGFRRSPIFPFLGRKHPVNRHIGFIFSRLGLQ